MDYLLDTHTFMWFINGEKELSDHARKTIEHKDVNNFVSIASLWEIAIKISIGKLKLKTPFVAIPQQIVDNGFQVLPIKFEDRFKLSTLPFHHRDPFDRMIIVQSITNQLTVISKDKQFADYGIAVIW
jgi:PIN domain nuclease of toxin-antitoxin system